VIPRDKKYLRQTVFYGRLVDMYSHFKSGIGNNFKHRPKIIISTVLFLEFPWLIRELKNHPGFGAYEFNFFGLARYNHSLISEGNIYFSLHKQLFGEYVSCYLLFALRNIGKNNVQLNNKFWESLENVLAKIVNQLATHLVDNGVKHIVALRDHFWYEAMLILASSSAQIPYHMVVHGYPHHSPEKSESVGILPFRGDYLYCISADSYRQLSQFVDKGQCRSVRLFNPLTNHQGKEILLISSSIEERGICGGDFRLSVYRELKNASDRTGRKIIVRFRDDENLAKKLPQVRDFGFMWTVRGKDPIEKDFQKSAIVFGFTSTALYLSYTLGIPTYALDKDIFIEGIENIAPSEMLDRIMHKKNNSLLDFRPTFADELSFVITSPAY
jgi:hypothetical protein